MDLNRAQPYLNPSHGIQVPIYGSPDPPPPHMVPPPHIVPPGQKWLLGGGTIWGGGGQGIRGGGVVVRRVARKKTADRDRLNDLIPTLMLPILMKMGHGQNELPQLKADLGRWVLRACNLALPDPIPHPLTSWEGVALTTPLLAKIGLHVFSIVPSEASVERSFSHQSLVHSDLRNRMAESTIHSVMYVRMNVGNFFDVPQVTKKAKTEDKKE